LIYFSLEKGLSISECLLVEAPCLFSRLRLLETSTSQKPLIYFSLEKGLSISE